MCIFKRVDVSTVPNNRAPIRNQETSQEDLRQFLLLVADIITAVLYDPPSLGMSEATALRYATSQLNEAVAKVAESSHFPTLAPAGTTLTSSELHRAVAILQSMAGS